MNYPLNPDKTVIQHVLRTTLPDGTQHDEPVKLDTPLVEPLFLKRDERSGRVVELVPLDLLAGLDH